MGGSVLSCVQRACQRGVSLIDLIHYIPQGIGEEGGEKLMVRISNLEPLLPSFSYQNMNLNPVLIYSHYAQL